MKNPRLKQAKKKKATAKETNLPSDIPFHYQSNFQLRLHVLSWKNAKEELSAKEEAASETDRSQVQTARENVTAAEKAFEEAQAKNQEAQTAYDDACTNVIVCIVGGGRRID